MDVKTLQEKLNQLDDGVLKYGSHQPGREFCALEFESQVRGKEWSDVPITLPDIRPLNDAFAENDMARTKALLPLMAALWTWDQWSQERKQKWAALVAVDTVRLIIAELPDLPTAIKEQCRQVKTTTEAVEAARAAAWAAARAAEAAWAAEAAARAAAWAAAGAAGAAWAAARAAARAAAGAAEAYLEPLNLACKIWIDAAEATADL